ncbi:MAG: TIGR03089 family protein [Micromonosporaceae bacterium]|nr:TIGR03089 family protein [Micromonosporaceae bacterium]
MVHAFTATVDARRDQPLITFYDDATGERTELSGATLANWVAKTANLLVDGLGLGPGQVAAVRLPPHWQTAAVLLGCWVAGLTVDLTGGRRADVAFVGPPSPALTAGGAPSPALNADEVYALALDPLGQPFRPGPPPGTSDFIVEMRPHGDRLPAIATTPEQVALAEGTRHADLVAQARQIGVPESARVLIDTDTHSDPVVWLVAPLLAGASVVVCRHLDPTRLPARLTTERADPFPSMG